LLTLLDWRCLAPTAEFVSVMDDVATHTIAHEAASL
jgi:hypothetical protein